MIRHAILALALAVTPFSAKAQDETASEAVAVSQPLQDRSADVVALINSEAAPEDVLTPAFLAAVPPAQLAALNAQLVSQYGPAMAVESITPQSDYNAEIEIRFERAIAQISLAVTPEAPHLIRGLLIRQVETLDDSFAKVTTDLDALPGEVGAYFGPLDGSEPVLSINPDQRFAIGSAFKLYVLASLAEEIKDGKRSWDDVVELDQKSFPSGMMQDWPQGSPVTLHTLASLMISISDNTATDQLIVELGRENVEQTLARSGYADPAQATPFLTTRELFALKGGPAETLEAYRSQTDTAAMRAILDELDTSGVTLDMVNAAFAGGPVAIDVEWFASANDLRRLFAFMRDKADATAFEIMAINPSIPPSARADWQYVGYKGGSEPGVLNLTWLLTDERGQDHILALSWNNPKAALENSTLEMMAQRILQLAR